MSEIETVNTPLGSPDSGESTKGGSLSDGDALNVLHLRLPKAMSILFSELPRTHSDASVAQRPHAPSAAEKIVSLADTPAFQAANQPQLRTRPATSGAAAFVPRWKRILDLTCI